MTKEMKDSLDREIDDALKSNDVRQILVAQSHYMKALSDCLFKTSDRLKQHLIDCDRAKYRLEGARLLWAALRYIVAAGGGAALLRLLTP